MRDDILVTSIAIDSEDKIFIGCSSLDYEIGAVWFSEDNGENWQLIESELIDIYSSIEFLLISEDDYVYAISYGGPINDIYRSVQPTTEINDFSIQNIIDCKLTNYPNPFNPSTTIKFSITEQCLVEIDIYDIKGRLVNKITKQKMEGGEHNVSWNGRDKNNQCSSSRIYLMNLKLDGVSKKTNKITLLK